MLSSRIQTFQSSDDGSAARLETLGIEDKLTKVVTQLYGDPTKRPQCYAADGFVVYIKSPENLRIVVKYPTNCNNCHSISRCFDTSLPCMACVRKGRTDICTLRISVAVKAEKILPVTMDDGKTALHIGTRSTPSSRVCANCKRPGHVKTNKKLCPLLNGQAEQSLHRDLVRMVFEMDRGNSR